MRTTFFRGIQAKLVGLFLLLTIASLAALTALFYQTTGKIISTSIRSPKSYTPSWSRAGLDGQRSPIRTQLGQRIGWQTEGVSTVTWPKISPLSTKGSKLGTERFRASSSAITTT